MNNDFLGTALDLFTVQHINTLSRMEVITANKNIPARSNSVADSELSNNRFHAVFVQKPTRYVLLIKGNMQFNCRRAI